MYDKAYVKNS